MSLLKKSQNFGVTYCPLLHTFHSLVISILAGILVCFARPTLLKKGSSRTESSTPRSLSALGAYITNVLPQISATVPTSPQYGYLYPSPSPSADQNISISNYYYQDKVDTSANLTVSCLFISTHTLFTCSSISCGYYLPSSVEGNDCFFGILYARIVTAWSNIVHYSS